MERDDLLHLLAGLAQGYIQGEMKPALFARTVEGLISSNLDTVPDLEEFHLTLADYGIRGAARRVTTDDLAAIARAIYEKAREEKAD